MASVPLTARQMQRLAQMMNRVVGEIDALGPEDSAYDAMECGRLGSEMSSLTRMLDGIRGPTC